MSNCLSSFLLYYDPWHSLPCSFRLFPLSIVFVLHASLTSVSLSIYISSQCHVCLHILNIELNSYLSCSTWLLFQISSIPIPAHFVHSVNLWTLHLWDSAPLVFTLILRIIPVHIIHSSTFQKLDSKPPFEIPWMQLKVGAAHELKPIPGNLHTSNIPALTSEEFE